MFYLKQSLQAWHTSAFNKILVQEISTINADLLPLQQGLTQSSYALSETLSAMVLQVTTDHTHIIVKAGLFYKGIISGCNCADDPTPVDQINEYCEVLLQINKNTAKTTVTLLD